jgi:MYXO-CTERM domain-containing protein
VYGRPVIKPCLLLLPGTAALAVGLGPAAAGAHFILQTPAAVYEQSGLGDPQKAPPCGDAGGAVPTGEVSSFQGGDTITITIDETIFHPGHYRVAIAVNDPSELPEEPPVTPADTDCGSAPIDANPVFPVLADGMLVHDSQFTGPQSFDVTLPADLACTSCTLQVIQFMSKHGLNNPGGCYYHHCAIIEVTPSAGTSEEGGESTATPDLTTTNASAPTEDPSASHGATTDGSAGGSTTDGTPGDPSEGEGACACASASGGDGLAGLLGLFGLLGLARRRR